MSRLIFNKFLGADYEGIKQGRLKFYNWTQPWKLGGKIAPTWKDIILHGVTALTLVNSKAGGLNYLTLYGGTEQLAETYIDSVTLDGKCEQSGTPTPTVPSPINCNNGAIKFSANMCNVNAQTALVGYYISTSGVVTADVYNWIYQDFIPVKPNTTYTLTMSSSVYYVSISEYSTADNSGFVVRKAGTTGSNTTLTITTEPTTNYIRFGTNINRGAVTLDKVLAIDWMLNIGNSLPYTPYIEGGIYTDGTVETATDNLGNVATAERLLSLGTYKDTQEVLSGSVTRNIGIKVLDGTENWQNLSGYMNIAKTDLGTNSTVMPNNSTNIICSHFETKTGTFVDGVGVGGSYVNFKYDSLFTTLAQWKQWLAQQYAQGTPVIIVYPLATATTETVTGQFLSKEPVTVTGSLTGLVANVVSSSHTTPTPTQPLPINCNNGVLKVSPNLFNKNSYTEINTYVNSNTGVLTQGSPGESTQYCAVIPCLPNTTYTISGRANSAWGAFTSRNIGTTATSFNKTENGSITTGANDKYLIGLVRANQNVIDYRNALQVELGSTATPYKPYGQIHTDGTVETVGITGKNLFDPTKVLFGYYRNATTGDKRQSAANFMSSDDGYIPCLPNTTYTFVGTNKTNGTYSKYNTIYFFDSAKNYLGASQYEVSQPTTTTTPNNCYYLQVRSNPLDTVSVSIQDAFSQFNWQLELGSTATTYEPYYNGGTATAEMLLKVDDYQDEQNVINGHVTRNVGIKVLNGTENWTSSAASSNLFYSSSAITNADTSNDYKPISTHFNGVLGSTGYATMQSGDFKHGSNNSTFYFKIPNITTAAECIQYFADQYNSGTPVIIVYPLATPTTETVTGQHLHIQAGTNTVAITQASIDDLELEVSYKAGVEVTVEEIENAQLDNSVEVTVNG